MLFRALSISNSQSKLISGIYFLVEKNKKYTLVDVKDTLSTGNTVVLDCFVIERNCSDDITTESQEQIRKPYWTIISNCSFPHAIMKHMLSLCEVHKLRARSDVPLARLYR